MTPVLQTVDFVLPDGQAAPGLVPVKASQQKLAGLSVSERAAVFDAKAFEFNDNEGKEDKSVIDYVYFRRFADGRSSQVAAYVVDNSDEHLDREALSKLHHQLWMHGTAPLLYVAWPTRIDVLTCARGPDFWDTQKKKTRYNPAATIETTAEIDAELQRRRQFSAYRLADGTFWDDPKNARLVKHDKAAHKSLIAAIVETDAALDGETHADQRRLLLLTILIKYLEDRKVFRPPSWFGRFCKGAKSFLDILRAAEPGAVHRLLSLLEDRFNGDIFRAPDGGDWKLTRQSLKHFVELFDAKTLNQQRYFWDQYSFEHLPVEIISHLYQHFVKGGHGTVYTPPILASLLLDHVMPYDTLSGNERVLDPACGSGIFLVGAFRRLVNVWRDSNDWRRPDVATLKGIVGRSIFGIELEPGAIDLAAFSLALAVCDALRPEVIWQDLRFEPLRDSNLFQADFFELVSDSLEAKTTILGNGFDVIVGNPPFESELTDAGETFARDKQPRLPDKKAAYLFLKLAASHLCEQGRLCLIQPAGLLYNRNAKAFRTALLQRNSVVSFFDFTSIRGLFDGADPKSIAISLVGETPNESHEIAHLTFRRTTSTKERVCFELDHYDWHVVPQFIAENDPFVWRTNLLGGGRLTELSRRLRQMGTLGEYVESLRKERGWDYGEGYIAAESGRREPAPWLTGKPLLPTEAFAASGIDESQIDTVQETHFRSAYTAARYTPPLVLIKKLSNFPVERWERGFLAYKDRILGIHAPAKDKAVLMNLYERLKHWTYLYQCFFLLHGSESIVSKATTIRKQDVDMLPYPKESQDLELSFWEQVLCDDVVELLSDYVRLGQSSKLLRDEASTNDLRLYSELYRRMLGSVYTNLEAGAAVFLNGLICQTFHFGDRSKLAWLENGDSQEHLEHLVYSQHQETLRTVRVVRFYDKNVNVIFIVKPDRLRYWIRTTAIRDADETLVDLWKRGR